MNQLTNNHEIHIAVLSDIHSNHIALQTCLDYLKERHINTYIFLGDYVSNCAYPEKTMQIIYSHAQKYTCYFIRGNREEMLINHTNGIEDNWHIPSTSSGSVLYTYNHLNENDIQFFRNMKHSDCIDIEGFPRIAICHGSMDSANDIITPENAAKYFDTYSTSLILCGHTHVMGYQNYLHGKVINTGSVGTPVNDIGDAEFVILHGTTSGWSEEFVTVPFDKKKVVQELNESGLIEQSKMFGRMIRDLLVTNQDRWDELLNCANQICIKETGHPNNNMDEKYLEMAATIIGIE